MTADHAAIAATTLRRLASEMRAHEDMGKDQLAGLPPAEFTRQMAEYNRASAAVAETRREAAADLERLARSLGPDGSNNPDRWCDAAHQAMTMAIIENQPTPETIDRWAASWERHSAGGAP